MNHKDFEKIVEDGIKTIPKRFLEKLNNIDICIEDKPSFHQLQRLKKRKNSVIFGLYEGIPQTERLHYGQVLPDKITIFKKSIEQFARSEKEIKEIVNNTVWHEIAHHFGMSEIRVRKTEYRRKKTA